MTARFSAPALAALLLCASTLGPAHALESRAPAAILLAQAAPAAEPAPRAADALLDEVWRTVRDRFYDPKMHGLDWEAARERHRPAMLAAASDEGRARVVNAMLDELKASHTRLYTQAEPAYYQLLDIFQGAVGREALRRMFPNGEIQYPGIGADTREDERGRAFVKGVIPGTPAGAAGLLVGDEIVSAGGAPFRPVASFRGKAGESVTLQVRREAGGPLIELPVLPEALRPGPMFLKGLEEGARVIEADGARVAYVRVWSYAGQQYQRSLERLISSGPLKDADALVWDLRDGWGGAQPWYLDLFNMRGVTLRTTDREGRSGIVNPKWRKPAAMLTNEGTRSGKEILAHGFKRQGIGELVGTRTTGAVLAGTAFLMGDDSLLVVAVNDVDVDGERLEGAGVTPTVEVPFDSRYAAGRDPQLDRAVEILSRARRG